MFSIVQDIFQSILKSKLALKWGTLCYFVHHLNRFSTDLDFDILSQTTELRDIMRQILQKYGTIKDEYNKKNTLFFLIDYGVHTRNIKIELSKKKSVFDTYETINFFGTDITAMTRDCIFANKFMALHRRMKSRDLFDVHFFFQQGFPIQKEIIENESKLSYKHFLEVLKNTIEKNYNEQNILAEIWDLITEKQKIIIKKSLKKETLWYIDFALQFYS